MPLVQTKIKAIFLNMGKGYIFRYADQVSLDDEVLVNKNDEFIPTRVINVSSLMMQGDHCS